MYTYITILIYFVLQNIQIWKFFKWDEIEDIQGTIHPKWSPCREIEVYKIPVGSHSKDSPKVYYHSCIPVSFINNFRCILCIQVTVKDDRIREKWKIHCHYGEKIIKMTGSIVNTLLHIMSYTYLRLVNATSEVLIR